MNLFHEIARTNAAYCAGLGISVPDVYGTQINEAELETHRLIAAGVPAHAAGMFSQDRIEAERLRLRKLVVRQQRDIRLANRSYAPGRFMRLVIAEKNLKWGA